VSGKDSEITSAFTGGLVVLSGPSGSGKTTICSRIRAHDRVSVSVSVTTRPRRTGEVDGRDYHFMTEDEFRAGIARGEFVEYNEVFGNGVFYGSLKSELDKAIQDGSRYYLMEIDVIGAQNLKKIGYGGHYIFIQPPDMVELENRLLGRSTEKEKDIEKRLEKAAWEMTQVKEYDRVVVNDDIERAVQEIEEYLGLA